MSTNELTGKVRELRELQRMAEELQGEIGKLQEEIKAEMSARQVEELLAGEYRVRWSTVTSTRIDTAALKRALPDVAAQFSRTSTTRRFCVA